MIYQDYNVRAVGLVDDNGVIIKEPLYRTYAENVKLLADSDSEYFTVVNVPSGRGDEEREDLRVTFSDEFNIIVVYHGLCINDVRTIEISSDEDSPAVIYSGEDDLCETYGISCPDAFPEENKGDYCFKLEFDFEESIKELDERPTAFFKLHLMKTPDKVSDMKYPCMITEVDSGTSFINGQGITLKAYLSPMMLEPVFLSAFGSCDVYGVDYHKIAAMCKRYGSMLKYLQYSNNMIVYDREKKMINIKHIFIDSNMKQMIISNEYVNRVARIAPSDIDSGVWEYYELLNKDMLLSQVLASSDDYENIVMVGNSPIIGRDAFYNMNEDDISNGIKDEVYKIYEKLDKECEAIDMNSLRGFDFSKIVNCRFEEENIFYHLLELLDSDEGVLIYEPNERSEDFHLVFMCK